MDHQLKTLKTRTTVACGCCIPLSLVPVVVSLDLRVLALFQNTLHLREDGAIMHTKAGSGAAARASANASVKS